MACTQWYFKAIVLVLSVINSSKCDELIVTTSLGKVEGKQVDSILPNEKYYAFLGIPYAKPPVGELRFMPTKPHEGWDEILSCKKPKTACAQFYVPHRDIEFKRHGFFGDEDCLYLNVFTPKVPTNEDLSFPVIVYFFNDNLKTSSNFTKDYGPDFLMKEDVIIVTINHRLGALGFLSYEDDLLPGNNGLRDVIMGLEWVRDNIKNFGGNPAKVTLMGSQGGAVIVDILLQVPKAKGLFSGAILQSGTALNSMYFGGEGKKRAKELANYLETISSSSSSLLKGFAALHAMNITEGEIMSVHADEARSVQRGIPAFVPVVEHDHPDAIIRKLPEDEPIDIEVPVMIGSTSNEGIEYCERYLRKPQFLTFADRDFLLLFPIRSNYHFKINDDVYTDAVKELKDFYLEEGYIRVSKPGEYITYMGDIFQNYPIDYAVRTYAKHSKAPVYYYNFDYSGDLNYNKNSILKSSLNTDGTWGATATDDLCYLFVCKPIKNLYVKALQDDDSEELSVLRKMVKLWTDFAKTGNPTPQADEVTWTPTTAENREVLVISDELEMKSNLNADRFQFLDDFIARHRERAVDGIIQDIKDEL